MREAEKARSDGRARGLAQYGVPIVDGRSVERPEGTILLLQRQEALGAVGRQRKELGREGEGGGGGKSDETRPAIRQTRSTVGAQHAAPGTRPALCPRQQNGGAWEGAGGVPCLELGHVAELRDHLLGFGELAQKGRVARDEPAQQREAEGVARVQIVLQELLGRAAHLGREQRRGEEGRREEEDASLDGQNRGDIDFLMRSYHDSLNAACPPQKSQPIPAPGTKAKRPIQLARGGVRCQLLSASEVSSGLCFRTDKILHGRQLVERVHNEATIALFAVHEGERFARSPIRSWRPLHADTLREWVQGVFCSSEGRTVRKPSVRETARTSSTAGTGPVRNRVGDR